MRGMGVGANAGRAGGGGGTRDAFDGIGGRSSNVKGASSNGGGAGRCAIGCGFETRGGIGGNWSKLNDGSGSASTGAAATNWLPRR